MRRLALLLPLALASTGMICGGSPGALQNPREGVFAATDAQVHVIDERGAQVRVRVDGGGRVELFPPGYGLTASDDAGALFVLSDSLIALNKFHSPVPYARELIMTTYYAGQGLIIWGKLGQRSMK